MPRRKPPEDVRSIPARSTRGLGSAGCGPVSERDGWSPIAASGCWRRERRTLRWGLRRQGKRRGMDQELEALDKTRAHVADIATPAGMAKGHLQ